MSDNIQILSEKDRAVLREYLQRRLDVIRAEMRLTIDAEEISNASGAEMEILFAFDELLGEEPPESEEEVDQ